MDTGVLWVNLFAAFFGVLFFLLGFLFGRHSVPSPEPQKRKERLLALRPAIRDELFGPLEPVSPKDQRRYREAVNPLRPKEEDEDYGGF